MEFGEVMAFIVTMLLAIYGCAQLVRRLSLWMTRCPRDVVCYRVVIPRRDMALEPLMHCLQASAVWDESGQCRQTLLLLTDERMTALPSSVLKENRCIKPISLTQAVDLLSDEVLVN